MQAQQHTAITNLRRLTALRAIALGGYIAASVLLGDTLSTPALAFVGLGAVTTVISGWRGRRQSLQQLEFFGHLLMDWLWLPPLLAFSGGAANPFVTYLLVPLTIAAATLPRTYSWLMAILSIAIYTGLMVMFPGAESSAHGPHGGHVNGAATGMDFYRHLLGMWATFVFSALLIAGFVNRMAETLRQRDRHLHQLRQEQARREQILSLGTLAAGTAHELASPLQTIALLVEELQARQENSSALNEDLTLLQQQVNLCKEALAQLRERARDPEQSEEVQPVSAFIARCLERWQLLRPDARFRLQCDGPADTQACLPLTLEQALINLLNNAADACREPVSIAAQWDVRQLEIAVTDRGPGVNPARAGESRGFGIGLILGEAALAQLGGALTVNDAEPGRGSGTVARIRLPIRLPNNPSESASGTEGELS
ncbi:sensor histidine kinase [Microbulbifer celer]|uniref:histidine kinase n=1 Tax=Microbulbifer celer TaxID=435905 RepID=A0ABW3UCF4_9GAMM|nr:HAMP domain-containing sensor histidine kinase [Microbulbifer celer]UFN57591.1 hypothetical protein LPW13_00675 [Microbulbifer celer]